MKLSVLITLLILFAAVIGLVIWYRYDMINGNWPPPTPSPTPELTPTPKGVFPTTAAPAPTPYYCQVQINVQPLPYCIDWVKWWWETDGDSWQNYLGTWQSYGRDGIYKQWFNFTDYAKWVALQMSCQKGNYKTGITTENFWYNFTPEQMNIIVSNESWLGPQEENSWYVWCAEKPVPYTALWYSYSSSKTDPKPVTINNGPDGVQGVWGNIWIFATTKDDTRVAKVDFYRNDTFYRTELNPPYDFMPSAGPFLANREGMIIKIGARTTLKNGTILPMEEGWLYVGHIPPICGDGYCTGDENPSNCPGDCIVPTPTPSPTPFCGDENCNGAETCATCPADCGACPPICGDKQCNGDETCVTCELDCGKCAPYCGNQACDGEETCWTCPGDCGPCPTCDCCMWCVASGDITVTQQCQPLPIDIDGIEFACIINSGGQYECTQVST